MFLCMARNYWGRGETIAKAKANAKKEGADLRQHVIFESDDPTIAVDGMGYITHDRGTTLKEVVRFPKSLK